MESLKKAKEFIWDGKSENEQKACQEEREVLMNCVLDSECFKVDL